MLYYSHSLLHRPVAPGKIARSFQSPAKIDEVFLTGFHMLSSYLLLNARCNLLSVLCVRAQTHNHSDPHQFSEVRTQKTLVLHNPGGLTPRIFEANTYMPLSGRTRVGIDNVLIDR